MLIDFSISLFYCLLSTLLPCPIKENCHLLYSMETIGAVKVLYDCILALLLGAFNLDI